MRRERTITGILLCLLLTAVVLSGCRKAPDEEGPSVYYLDTKELRLVKENYEFKGEAEEQIDKVLELLQEPEDEDYKSVLPEDIKVEKWEKDDTALTLHFGKEYQEIPASAELFLRAAVVQSLTQVPGVDSVQFYIEEQPLADGEGRELGYMRAEDFVQNTGSSLHSYQTADVTLYFANSAGDKLVPEEISVRYNSNMSIEKLIVEKLMSGPSASGSKKVIPEGTKLLGVSIIDQVCYVNFDEGLLKIPEQVNPKVTIYALVNSIVDGGAVTRVQILVNGETDITYREVVDLSKPLPRDDSLIEEK